VGVWVRGDFSVTAGLKEGPQTEAGRERERGIDTAHTCISAWIGVGRLSVSSVCMCVCVYVCDVCGGCHVKVGTVAGSLPNYLPAILLLALQRDACG